MEIKTDVVKMKKFLNKPNLTSIVLNPSPYVRIALFSSLGVLGFLAAINATLITITLKKINKEAIVRRKEIADKIYKTTNEKVYILS